MAEALDGLIDWVSARFRPFVYGMLTGIIFTIACTVAAQAASYPKPSGVPEIYLASKGVTVGVWAAQTAVGHGIGIFEKKDGSADWSLCFNCLISPELPTMDSAVNGAGGPEAYVASKLPAINATLAAKYSGVSPDLATGMTMERVNGALSSYALRIVNGSPQLGAK